MKRVIPLLLAVFITLTMLQPCFFATAEDSTVYVKKHVSILYDNSGSMKERTGGEQNLKWCYASYAAQVFTGLLNDTDTLSITFMEGDPLSDLDLKGPRQKAVSAVLERTKTAQADTPIKQITAALAVLEKGGLKTGLGSNAPGEQYWLVLTTDGVFRENSSSVPVDRVVSELEAIMDKYPDLHVVYFGIGTKNDNSENKAVDFRSDSNVERSLLDRLHSHANFSAVYAESQDEIVDTMKKLSNQISGRYSVTNEYEVSGTEVRLYLSGEGSPIRNIAVMAQQTDARLVSAVTESGAKLTIDREAEIRYPYNSNYANVPDDTLGGYVSLIAGPGGSKVPNGMVTLTFSEPVNKEQISLMYEPAIHIRLQIERKNSEGKWETVPYSADLIEGDEIRVSYAICEDETDKELDTSKLFGKTESHILLNGRELKDGQSAVLEQGDALVDVRISMMDGGYQISTSQTLHVGLPGAGDFSVSSSGPIELQRSAAAQNTAKAVEFTVLFRGETPDPSRTKGMRLQVTGDDGALKGKMENPAPNIFRFTPQDDSCKAGEYTVHLVLDGTDMASETIRILPNEATYTAEAGPSISVMSNEVASNRTPVTFTVTAHRDEGDEPITPAEADLFTVRAEDGDKSVSGQTGWQDGGVITFTMQDASVAAGNYGVGLWKGEEKLAQTHITVIHYDAYYTVETVVSEPNEVDRFALNNNTANVSFIVYEDGVPCTPSQLESMLERQLIVSSSPEEPHVKIDVQIGTVKGKTALICTPHDSTRSWIALLFRHELMSFGLTGPHKGPFKICLQVDMPHGDADMGELELTGDRPLYWIISLIILGILVIIGIVILDNVKAFRLKKGTIWTFSMRYDEDAGCYQASRNGGSTATGWGWKPMFPVPIDESHVINNVHFVAARNQGRRKRRRNKERTFLSFIRQHPMVVLKAHQVHNLGLFYHSDISPDVAELLKKIGSEGAAELRNGPEVYDEESFFSCKAQIANVDPTFQMESNEIQSDTPTVSAAKKRRRGRKRKSPKAKAVLQKVETVGQTATYQISSNSAMIYKKSRDEANADIMVWVYQAREKQSQGSRSRAYVKRKRKKR